MRGRCVLTLASHTFGFTAVLFRLHAVVNTHLLQWRHKDHKSVSKHRHLDCFLNCLFRHRSKKTSKLRVTGLCEGNLPVTDGFPPQRGSYAENVSIWWRHPVLILKCVYNHLISFENLSCQNIWDEWPFAMQYYGPVIYESGTFIE